MEKKEELEVEELQRQEELKETERVREAGETRGSKIDDEEELEVFISLPELVDLSHLFQSIAFCWDLECGPLFAKCRLVLVISLTMTTGNQGECASFSFCFGDAIFWGGAAAGNERNKFINYFNQK